ncbi:hypothetical protein K457DRAFT_79794, partial [Linnemannia elongata AG-77]
WVNNPALTEFCFSMIERADIEGSKSNIAMNAWLPQAHCPCCIILPHCVALLMFLPSLPFVSCIHVVHYDMKAIDA